MTHPIQRATEARSGLDHETGDTMLVLTGDGQEVLAAALLSPADTEALIARLAESAKAGRLIQSAGMASEHGGMA